MDYVEQAFEGERVPLDNNTFDRCVFRNCTLVHEGGSFEIRNGLRVEGQVAFDLRGGEATLSLLDILGSNFGYIDILGTRYVREGGASAGVGLTHGYNDQRPASGG